MKTVSNKLLIVIFIFVLVAVYTVAGFFIIAPEPLVIQGEVVATQVRVASKIAGRVETLHIKEGSSVEKGQLLVTIESPEIDAKLRQANAAKAAATAQKNKADKGARVEEILTAKNMWKKAKVADNLTKKTYNRVKNLHKDGVVPVQKLDEAKAQYMASKRTTEIAKATYDMAQKGAREEDKNAAYAMMNKAEGAVAEVEAYLNETMLKAPLNSEVTSIVPKVGELITPGFPIVNLVDLNDVWVSFNLREDLLSGIKMGSTFKAKFPALNNREVELKVTYITALGQFATWHATKASGDFDLKTFEVRAVPVVKVDGLRPGMSALVNWESIEIQEK